MNLSKSRAVDRPIHESNLHELEHCQHPQSELLSFILCAWIMTSTQSRGDMIHGDPLQHGLFLQKSSCHDLSIFYFKKKWSEYLIASRHWPTMILPSFRLVTYHWVFRDRLSGRLPFGQGTSYMSNNSIRPQPRNIAICMEVKDGNYCAPEMYKWNLNIGKVTFDFSGCLVQVRV